MGWKSPWPGCRVVRHVVDMALCLVSYLLYFIKLRDQRSDRSPCSSMMEMEPEKANVRRGLSADTSSYRCAACHGDEDAVLGHPIRGRAKSRSLSASPALASTKEFRYDSPPRPRTSQLHAHTALSAAQLCPQWCPCRCPQRGVAQAPLPAGLAGPQQPQGGWTSVPTSTPGRLLLHKTLSHRVQSGVRPAGQAR